MVDFTEAHRARMIEVFENTQRGNKITKTRTPRFAPVVEEDNKLLDECIALVRAWAAKTAGK